MGENKTKVVAEKKKSYKLLEDVSIGGKLEKAGKLYPLTEKTAQYFKQKKYI